MNKKEIIKFIVVPIISAIIVAVAGIITAVILNNNRNLLTSKESSSLESIKVSTEDTGISEIPAEVDKETTDQEISTQSETNENIITEEENDTEATIEKPIEEETTPSDTSITVETPEPVVANFSDNFDIAPSNYWETASGTWRVVNGALAVDETDGIIAYNMVGELGWRDYSVETDISVLCQGGYPIILLIRSLDAGNGMQMHINCCDTMWILYENGKGNIIAESEEGIPYKCGTDSWTTSHIKIQVQGNQYTMYLNGASILQVTDNTYSYGKSGVGIECPFDCARFDNFKITNIPY